MDKDRQPSFESNIESIAERKAADSEGGAGLRRRSGSGGMRAPGGESGGVHNGVYGRSAALEGAGAGGYSVGSRSGPPTAGEMGGGLESYGSSAAYVRYLWALGITAFLLFAAVCALNYVVDPLQFYRQATWYTPIFSEEQRFQNAGLARNWEYNTIILGTSMTENFVPSHVDASFGGGTRTLKLSISGSSLYEERLAGEVALRTGQVKRIIWGLDYASFRGGKELLHEESGPYPLYLYDTNVLNDVKYLFNISTLEQSLRILKRKFTGTEQPAIPLDLLNNWYHRYSYLFKLQSVYDHYEQAKQADIAAVARGESDSLEDAKASFDHNVLRIVREHPEIEFHFFYPPYSILRFQLWYEYQRQRFDNQMAIKLYIYEQLSRYPNVHIHDFQSESEITHQLTYYKDVSHYSQAINEYIIEHMIKGTYEMRSIEDVKRMNDELLRQVRAYVFDAPNTSQQP